MGDLGVAASLSDEEALLAPSTSRSVANAVAVVDGVRPTQARPYQGLGKRKSFVGTVRHSHLGPRILYRSIKRHYFLTLCNTALLDGAGANPWETVRL